MQTTALLDTTFGRPLSLSRFSENFSLSRTGSGGDITAATVQLERSELEASSTYAAVDPPSPEALERSPRIRAAGDDAEHLAQTLDTSATFFLSEGTGTRSELPTAPPSPLAGALRPGKCGAAKLQENLHELKVELNESREEARRYRQRLVHLEGDAHGKSQWALQWERQVAAALPPPAPGMEAELDLPGLGPAGLGWSAWKVFIDRALVESLKTQRLLPRAPQVEWHRATRDHLEDEARAVATELREAEQSLLDAGTENARMLAQIRRCETREREHDRKRTSVETLQQELASRDRDRKSVLACEEAQQRYYLALHAELGEAQRLLDDTPQEQMLRRVQRAVEQREYFDHEMHNLDNEAEEAARLSWEVHEDEMSQMSMDVRTIEATLQALQAESVVEEEAYQHEEAAMAEDERLAQERQQHTVEMAREARREAARLKHKQAVHDELDRDLEEWLSALRIQCLFRGHRVRKASRMRA